MNPIPNTLIEQLQHPDANKRSEAVLSLNSLDNPQKLPFLIQALRTEPNLYVREDITYALMNMNNLAIPPLLALLDENDAHIRHHAAHTLGKLKNTQAIDALIRTLQDPDAIVLAKTIFALGQIGDTQAIVPLVQLIGHDNREIQSTLASVLEVFGASAVPPLLDALHDTRWQVREQVTEILGIIGDETALSALIAGLQDEYWQVRFAAVMALGYVGGKVAKNALQNKSHDENTRVNDLVTKILAGMR